MSADRQDSMRVALHAMGIPLEDDWVIQEINLRRDIVNVPDVDSADVYGNEHSRVEIVGQHLTLSVYRAEN